MNVVSKGRIWLKINTVKRWNSGPSADTDVLMQRGLLEDSRRVLLSSQIWIMNNVSSSLSTPILRCVSGVCQPQKGIYILMRQQRMSDRWTGARCANMMREDERIKRKEHWRMEKCEVWHQNRSGTVHPERSPQLPAARWVPVWTSSCCSAFELVHTHRLLWNQTPHIKASPWDTHTHAGRRDRDREHNREKQQHHRQAGAFL